MGNDNIIAFRTREQLRKYLGYFLPSSKGGDFQTPPLRTAAGYDILRTVSTNGEVAQLVEHHVRNVGVESSNLFFSTNSQGTANPLSTNEIKVARGFLLP